MAVTRSLTCLLHDPGQPPILPDPCSFRKGNQPLKYVGVPEQDCGPRDGFGLLASKNLTDWQRIVAGFTDANGGLFFQDTNAANFPNR